MDGEKIWNNLITLRLDQLTDVFNRTTCLTGHLIASLQVHITWGRLGILSEEKCLDYLLDRKLFDQLILVKAAGGP